MRHRAKLLGMARSTLIGIGAFAVSAGYMTEENVIDFLRQWDTMIGAASMLIGYVWSWTSRDKLVGEGDLPKGQQWQRRAGHDR